jgi:hypothetical protein
MFVLLGYSQEHRPLESMLTTHCRCCGKEASWTLWRETGWVSLFFMRLLPLGREDRLVCEACDDAVSVDRQTAKMALDRDQLSPILKQIIHDRLVMLIDVHQRDATHTPERSRVAGQSDHRVR